MSILLLATAGGRLLAGQISGAGQAALYAQQAEPPGLVVSPEALDFNAALDQPQVMTASLAISSTIGSVTWTVTALPSGTLGLDLWPTSGIESGLVSVSVDSAGYPAGVYSTLVQVKATTGTPVSVPVTLKVTQDLWQVFLPLSAKPEPLPTPQPTPAPDLVPPTQFGLSFVTSAEAPAGALRLQRAVEAGARHDRWPFYWGYIEKENGVFDWSAHDLAVAADLEHGLALDAILMMPPAFHRKGPCDGLAARAYETPPRIGPAARRQFTPALQSALVERDCTTPVNLDQPVFSDGSDVPGPGKTINPGNPWARFVYETVTRYKPGGRLGTERNWPAGQGVRVWEIWNEPDWTWFWNGNAADFARTVAVAYLAARQADPQARVMMGGISDINERPDWLKDTLDRLVAFPDAGSQGGYLDAVAVHTYAWAWNTWQQLYKAQQQLAGHGLSGKGLWVNESGVPVLDDPAVPINDPDSPYRATMVEQADYVLQSAIYARWMGAEAVYHFQLYDDCGNGPGMLDAFGLRRNDAGAPAGCYPSDEGARPSFTAYQIAARHLSDLQPCWRWRPPAPGGSGPAPQEWLAFYSPATGKRVVALWARIDEDQTAVLTATSTSAVLVTPDGAEQIVLAEAGQYVLRLPAATNHNTPTNDGSAPIGGRTLLVIESDPSGAGGPRPSPSGY